MPPKIDYGGLEPRRDAPPPVYEFEQPDKRHEMPHAREVQELPAAYGSGLGRYVSPTARPGIESRHELGIGG